MPAELWNRWNETWRDPFRRESEKAMQGSDSGHGIDHIQRVVVNSITIGQVEGVDPWVVLPAAWLHDCISIPKNSPDRHLASRLAADQALKILKSIEYPARFVDAIHHAIAAHSFSAGISCESPEARVVQDADRLEALGAIGMARCFMTGGAMGNQLYCGEQPIPMDRKLDDRQYSVDHFFAKLFRLPATMQTVSGRREAICRVQCMVQYLEQLCREIGCPIESLKRALESYSDLNALE